jgi:hypothetical protein
MEATVLKMSVCRFTLVIETESLLEDLEGAIPYAQRELESMIRSHVPTHIEEKKREHQEEVRRSLPKEVFERLRKSSFPLSGNPKDWGFREG